jgi:hypothetical protein
MLILRFTGFLNWCQNRSVWLSVRQFLPSVAWLAAWLLLIKLRPSLYQRYRQPLVLVMRCGMMMSEARALRDGGEPHTCARMLGSVKQLKSVAAYKSAAAAAAAAAAAGQSPTQSRA